MNRVLGLHHLRVFTDKVTDPDPETFQLGKFKSCILLLKYSLRIILLPFSVLEKFAQKVFAVCMHILTAIAGSVRMH